MRIAIITRMFPPEWLGGTEIAAYDIAQHLAGRGHDVHVITSMDKGLHQVTTKGWFHIHRLKYPGLGLLSTVPFSVAAVVALHRINPSLVHVQCPFYGMAGYFYSKLAKKPYVVYFRGDDAYLPYSGTRFFLKLIVRNAAKVIALTEHMRRAVRKQYNRDALVIPNGVDVTKFAGLSREATRTELKIKESEQVVIFVGSLIPVKGMKYLVEAMNIIKQECLKARLLVVGDGEERQNLEELTNKLNLVECVTFVGRVVNERVPEYLVVSDLFVLPSLSEGFPLVVLEAMAAGLPIITTNVRGLPEIVKDGENGFVVEPQNPRQLVEKISLLLSNNELRQKISANNIIKAKQHSWEAVVEKLEEVYFSCSNQNLL